MSITDKFEKIRTAVNDWLGGEKNPDLPQAPEPNEDTEKTHEYVQSLYEEGKQYEDDHFAETAHMRMVMGGATGTLTPEQFRRACDSLVAGNVWDVLGRRNDTDETKWKQEMVEGLIQSNMRIRGSYISANWHDISITPNVQYSSQIFDQERMQIGWAEFAHEYRQIAQQYGVAVGRVYFENDDDGGHVRVMCCKPGTVVVTPNSSSMEERDGCWYVVVGTMINDQQLRKFYPDVADEAQSRTNLSMKYNPPTLQKGEYEHTKMYPKLELYMDDETVVEREMTEEEQDDLRAELEALALGEPVPVQQGQNSKAHIAAKTEALQNFLSSVKGEEDNLSDEDMDFTGRVIEAFTANIADHTEAMKSGDLASLGLEMKYPYGRYICSVGGQVDEDIPNPLQVPWRKLFRVVKNEKVYGRIDGRGDPEVLFHDEKKASTALSRFEDTVLLSMPKRYRKLDDKLNKATNAEIEDNDPLAVAYYVTNPPVSISGKVSMESLEMRNVVVANAEKKGGVNNITIGGEPKGQSSGFQTQLLQKQNETIVTGELDANLRSAIEDIVECMLMLYRVFYREPRQYNINGQMRILNVSRMFSEIQAIDEYGKPVIVKNPKLEITAKPFSNFPNRFEVELGALVEIYNLKREDGMPMIPSSAILKFLATKYPEAGENGEWEQLTQATKIGLQFLQQQQEEQQMAQAAQQQQQKKSKIDEVASRFGRELANKNGG